MVDLSPAVACTAADLPPGRRATLVWGLCWIEGFDLHRPLDEFVDDSLCEPCTPVAFDRAVVDSSGVYHLFREGRSFCLGGFTASEWCEGQVRCGRSDADPVFDVPSVPAGERCERAAGRWPKGLTGGGPRAAVRRRLVEALGPGCATCPDPWAVAIDHDHLTGRVRGYLCGSCNARVDQCRHLAGCRFADYLNAPPAFGLDLVCPGWQSLAAAARGGERRQRFALAYS